MKIIDNVGIGRKIALVLGGTVLLLTLLSGLSLWALRTVERLMTDSVERLAMSQLAQKIAFDQANISIDYGKMVTGRKASDALIKEELAYRTSRDAELARFRAGADTPESVRHGEEMADIASRRNAANERILSALQAGHFDDAAREYNLPLGKYSLRAKATEASQWQEKLVAENETKRAHTSSLVWMTIVGGCLATALGAGLGGILLTRGIATPLASTVARLNEIAHGNLSNDAPSGFEEREDEIGTLARALQTMTVSLRKMIREVSGGIETLSSSSAQLLASSGEMTSGSRHASDTVNSVAVAAEEMCSNITSVAAGMEQTTRNLSEVASATEQMTSTIGEIAVNSEKARAITESATRQAVLITEQINQLGAAAQEIGKVTEAITEISSQTNLLALNATIEAARAGSAGKGFAVVATEIKALAQQTAAATEDIKTRIAGVQAATAGGIAEIAKVSQVIAEVSGIVASIAAAIEEQSTATRGIARNIAEASRGVTEANGRVSETSLVSREIARDIASVDRSTREMAGGSDRVRSSAGDLSAVAEALRETIGTFTSAR